ncbi:MAG: NAD(P)/FAD-dependent oxidoreductase [Treponema sp.]|nr:NAD(P)/FAD-dependent oxidoreductase [Treponema sp.]
MTLIAKVNKKLENNFGGRVRAEIKDGILYLTGRLPYWNDVVRAGLISAQNKKYTVVNNIVYTSEMIPPTRLPSASDKSLAGRRPDVLVIGGGIVGCAIARELTRYKLDVMLVEKEHDVALHASGRNDGIIHPGLDLRKGQLKKKYNDAGNRMYPTVCAELDVPFQYTGQYLCFTDKWMKPAAIASLLYWKAMGIPAAYISRSELAEKEPHLSGEIQFALYFPTAGVVCPYDLTIAYAENAADNGAKIYFDTAVTDIETRDGNIESVLTNRGRVFPKLTINAAGVFTEEIAHLAQDRFFSIHPRRGVNIIFDKKAAFLVKTIASLFDRSQEKHTKGGCIVHTADGNLLVGPNAVETFDRENFSTDRESIKAVLAKQRKTANLSEGDIITCFTGIRAATYEEDFIVSFGRHTKNIIHAAGIQSPGLTAAPAIAADISRMAAEFLNASANENFDPVRTAIIRAAELSDVERDALIKEKPDYGVIVCRCEEISRGEVLAALRRSVPCDTVDGVKRRVRPGMGRCQGSFCSPHIAEIIAGEKKIPVTEVRKMSDNSRILLGDNKESL